MHTHQDLEGYEHLPYTYTILFVPSPMLVLDKILSHLCSVVHTILIKH